MDQRSLSLFSKGKNTVPEGLKLVQGHTVQLCDPRSNIFFGSVMGLWIRVPYTHNGTSLFLEALFSRAEKLVASEPIWSPVDKAFSDWPQAPPSNALHQEPSA